jgi:hypothetical protein
MSWFRRLVGVKHAYEDERRRPVRFDWTGRDPQRLDAKHWA